MSGTGRCCARRRALLVASVASAPFVGLGSDGRAQVPSLSASPSDYVGYSVTNLPSNFRTPQLNALDNTPGDNPITNAGAELGRVLFYDGRLSHDNGTSCASCHSQETGFTDPDQFSVGFAGGLTGRHSMGLSNARWYTNRDGQGRFFWDERASSLEDQVLRPIQDAVEMGSDLSQLIQELNATDFYPTLFQRAFGNGEVTSEGMSRALAQFVRSMASYQSPFDRAVAAGSTAAPDFAAAGVADATLAAQGHAVFAGSCAGCHRTDAEVANNTHNIGLPPIDADGDGVIDSDPGAGAQQFKVPSLRNVAVRGRFMHDGRFQSLEEVIDFYSFGVSVNGDPLGPGLRPGGFRFSAAQQEALLAFLRTLTDAEFLASDLFSNPLVSLPGDYDGSGVVDDEDRAAWAASYGANDPDGLHPSDGNGDGRVDAADYSVWRTNLGRRWDDALSALAQVVPEPSAVGLAGLGLAAVWRRRAG